MWHKTTLKSSATKMRLLRHRCKYAGAFVYRGWMLAACGKTQTLVAESIPAIMTTILHVRVCR